MMFTGDFWRMIWQQDIKTICMLSKRIEENREKVADYYPITNTPYEFDGMEISLKNTEEIGDYIVRKVCSFILF